MKILNTISDLAYWGGVPIFNTPKPIGQLYTPDIDEYLKLIKGSYDASHLTNNGPLVDILENDLAAYHNVKYCISVANAALGIMMLINTFSSSEIGEVIMPSFSYRGLPHFARWANQTPVFCDVDPIKHTLIPNNVEECINKRTTSILHVANFNHPGDLDELSDIAKKHKVPIFMDSVYAIGSTYNNKLLGGFTDAEVYSLHATKLLNGYEGGYITTNNKRIAESLQQQRNFFIANNNKNKFFEHTIGLNAKLNELHAGMAILSLRDIDIIIDRNKQRYMAYKNRIDNLVGVSLIKYQENESSNYQLAVLEINDEWPLSRDKTIEILNAEGVSISAYYSPPLHLSENNLDGITCSKLENTINLSSKYLQLPVGELVSLEDVEAICDILEYISTNPNLFSIHNC